MNGRYLQPRKWVLHTSQDTSPLFDEFLCDRFHLRLSGNSLMVDIEENGDDELHSAVADFGARYAAALRQYAHVGFILMTEEELVTLPPQGITIRGANAQEEKRLRRARHHPRPLWLGPGCLAGGSVYAETKRLWTR